MLSPGKLLVIGCPTCNLGLGEIYFYDTDSLSLIHTLEGDRSHTRVGERIVYRENTYGAEQFWYSSEEKEISLNSIVFFKGRYTFEWGSK